MATSIMKWLLACVVLLALGTVAHANPKVAVVTIDGDSANNQLTGVVVEVAGQSATVIDNDAVDQAMHSLAIDGVPEGADLKKLRGRLKVDVILTGKVAKDGSKLKLTLVATGKGGKNETFGLRFTKSSAKTFRTELAEAIEKHVGAVAGTGDGDDDEDETPKKPPPKKEPVDDITKRPHDKDRDPDEGGEKKPPKKVAHRDAETTDDDEHSVHRRHRSALGDRNLVTQGALWADAGPAALVRKLTYGTAPNPPPPVGTAGATAELDAAYYTGDGASGFGGVLRVQQTLGVAIAVPQSTAKCAITEGIYQIGVRYRLPFAGDSSLAFGANYLRYRYIADRSQLQNPTSLPMPDVDYSALAPAADLKYALSPAAAIYGTLTIPIILDTGPAKADYGAAGGISFTLDAGIDYKLNEHYALRFGAVFDQLGLKFDKTNATAQMRGLTTATDRSMGGVAAFAMVY